jgi:hypothetical protein
MPAERNQTTMTDKERAAIARLLDIARTGTGQSRRVANFLLAWHNAEENGGWDPTDLWGMDDQIVLDIVAVIGLIRRIHAYPGDLGFKVEIEGVWECWRGTTRENRDHARG